MRNHLSPEHKTFFKRLGARIRAFRQKFGVTQVQLAEVLDCSQQQIVAFEQGKTRLPVTALPPLARHFGVAVEDLLGMSGEPVQKRVAKPGPSSKLEQQLEQLTKLPRSKQRMVSEMLDGILLQANG